jgi:hypothetical protein
MPSSPINIGQQLGQKVIFSCIMYNSNVSFTGIHHSVVFKSVCRNYAICSLKNRSLKGIVYKLPSNATRNIPNWYFVCVVLCTIFMRLTERF